MWSHLSSVFVHYVGTTQDHKSGQAVCVHGGRWYKHLHMDGQTRQRRHKDQNKVRAADSVYEIFFASWNEKGCSKLMSLFLSKKVENWCMGMVKVNKTDIIYTCVLEVILQLPYSHYMNPVSYEFTNKFEKMSFNACTNNRGRWPDMLYMVSLLA